MTRPLSRALLALAAVAALVLGTAGPTPREAQARGGARAGGARAGGGARTNVNRNANVNQNVNVNRNVHMDVDRGYGGRGYGYGGGYGAPIARGVAVGATAAITAAAIGSIVYSLPPSCQTTVMNGLTYQQCGSSWYQPRYSGDQVTYVVVNPP